MSDVPMRTHCKYYESRTYRTGETVQKCDLDLAPEAPWRCPENCPAYAPRMVDAGWTFGGLNVQPEVPEPPNLGEHTARLLDEAEDIVNAVGPSILAEFRELDEKNRRRRFSIPGASGRAPHGGTKFRWPWRKRK